MLGALSARCIRLLHLLVLHDVCQAREEPLFAHLDHKVGQHRHHGHKQHEQIEHWGVEEVEDDVRRVGLVEGLQAVHHHERAVHDQRAHHRQPVVDIPGRREQRHLQRHGKHEARVGGQAGCPHAAHLAVRLGGHHAQGGEGPKEHAQRHPDSRQHPPHKRFSVERFVAAPVLVQRRERLQDLVGEVLVEPRNHDDGQRREDGVVHGEQEVKEHHLAAEVCKDAKPKLRQAQSHVLAEGVQYELGDALVRAVAVDQEEAPEVREPCNGKVAGNDRLHALLPTDAHTHVRLLDHGHIVGAVADGKRDGAVAPYEALF
mmetsp:Transcript_22338/g.56066  ORF Transcript_22338/g.56066 Transcript_22338/m.56066 type:complete len:316 (-) Transcript_22338:600-1547(-)